MPARALVGRQLAELDLVRLDDGIGEQSTTHLVDLREPPSSGASITSLMLFPTRTCETLS